MSLLDLLSFRSLMTPYVLVAVYYLGALAMPWLVYRLYRTLWRADGVRRKEKRDQASRPAPVRWGWSLFLLLFLSGELAWRIFIEFFVAYFQIREALVGA